MNLNRREMLAVTAAATFLDGNIPVEKPKPLDIVKEYFPSATDEQATSVLWICTGWPSFFAEDNPEVGLRRQLKEYSIKSNKNPWEACAIAENEMDRAMDEMKEREKWQAGNSLPF